MEHTIEQILEDLYKDISRSYKMLNQWKRKPSAYLSKDYIDTEKKIIRQKVIDAIKLEFVLFFITIKENFKRDKK